MRKISKGFTLVELIAVLILMGILASASSSLLVNQSPYQQRMAIDQTVAMLRDARNVAQSINCPVQVSYAAKVFTMSIAAGCNTSWAGSLYSMMCDSGCGPHSISASSIDAYKETVSVPTGLSVTTTGLPFFFTPGNQVKATGGSIVNPQISIGGQAISVMGQTGLING